MTCLWHFRSALCPIKTRQSVYRVIRINIYSRLIMLSDPPCYLTTVVGRLPGGVWSPEPARDVTLWQWSWIWQKVSLQRQPHLPCVAVKWKEAKEEHEIDMIDLLYIVIFFAIYSGWARVQSSGGREPWCTMKVDRANKPSLRGKDATRNNFIYVPKWRRSRKRRKEGEAWRQYWWSW